MDFAHSLSPAVSPRSRHFSLLGGVISGIVCALLISLFVPPSEWRGSFSILGQGVLCGVVTSALARTYYSGNPALAFALSLFGFSWMGVLLEGQVNSSWEVSLILSVFAPMVALVVCISACWATDVYWNFPRAYPRSEDRPPKKHVGWIIYKKRIIPGTSGLAVISALAILAFTLSYGKLGLPVAFSVYIFFLILGNYLLFQIVDLPGSLWIGFGPLLGLASFYLLALYLHFSGSTIGEEFTQVWASQNPMFFSSTAITIALLGKLRPKYAGKKT